MRQGLTVAAAAALAMVATPALAVIAYPVATPTNGATEAVSLAGLYTSLPTPPAQPLAALPFTLSITLPQAVSIQAVTLPYSFAYPNVVGSYANAGQTEFFSNGQLLVHEIMSASGATTQLTFSFSHVLTSTDGLAFDLTVAGLLYDFSADSRSATANPGPFVVLAGSADYTAAGDPPFTGIVTVTPNAVPEPSAWALMIAGGGGVGLALRRTRKRPAYAGCPGIDLQGR